MAESNQDRENGYWRGVVDTLIKRHKEEVDQLRHEMKVTVTQFNADLMLRLNDYRTDTLTRMQEQKTDITRTLLDVRDNLQAGMARDRQEWMRWAEQQRQDLQDEHREGIPVTQRVWMLAGTAGLIVGLVLAILGYLLKK